MSDEIWTWVFRAGALALFVGGAFGLKHLITWLGSKAQSSRIFAALQQVTVLADGVLSDVAAAVKPEIEAAAADGKLTAEERKAIGAKALEVLKQALGKRGQAQIGSLLGIGGGVLESWLSGVVQDRLSIKVGTTPAPVVPAAVVPAAPPPVPR